MQYICFRKKKVTSQAQRKILGTVKRTVGSTDQCIFFSGSSLQVCIPAALISARFHLQTVTLPVLQESSSASRNICFSRTSVLTTLHCTNLIGSKSRNKAKVGSSKKCLEIFIC